MTNAANPLSPSNDDHPLLVLGYTKFTPNISATSLATYQECKRKFLFQELFRLGPYKTDVYVKSLFIGTVFHKIMQHHVQGAPDVQRYQELGAMLTEAKQQVAQNPYATEGDADRVDKDFAMASAMAEYAKTLCPFPPDKWEVIGVEVKAEAELPGYRSKLVGRFDLVLRCRQTGDVWVVDYKTTSHPPDVASLVLQIARQPEIYTMLARGVWGDDVRGVFHVTLKKPTIYQKRNETFGEYIERVGEWYREKPEGDVHHVSQLRIPPDALDDQELMGLLHETGKAAAAQPLLHKFPKNATRCLSYGSICPFFRLCIPSPEFWGPILQGYFVVREKPDEPGGPDTTI